MNSSSLKENSIQMRQFFMSGKTRSVSFRIDALKKLKSNILKFESEIVEALHMDLHKSEMESILSEISPVLQEIDYNVKHIRGWLKPKRVKTPLTLQPAKSEIYVEPYGIALIISPWNYPFQLAISPLIGSIAAGNCSIILPSGKSKETSKMIKKLIESSFDPNHVSVYLGGGGKVSTELLNESIPDFVFFTGSTTIGRKIGSQCGEQLIPHVLELGGKSPAIIEKSANIKDATRKITWGKFMNAGQTCIAPDYLVVDRSIEAEVIQELRQQVEHFFGLDPKTSNSFGRIISTEKTRNLSELLNDGEVLYGGQWDEQEMYMAPTLLKIRNMDENIMKQEIFGPILPILTYDTPEGLLGIIQQNKYPLATYIFSQDREFQQWIIDRYSFGGGCINHCLMHQTNHHLPFGGIQESGRGRYHGKHSFETFSHQKSIYTGSSMMDMGLKYPPYTSKKMYWIKKLLGMGSKP